MMLDFSSPLAYPLNVALLQQVNSTAGGSFSLNCSLTLPQWAKAFERPSIEFVNIQNDGSVMIEQNPELLNGAFKYIKTLKFTTLQISHGGQYKCQVGFRSQIAEKETRLIVKSKWRRCYTGHIFTC